MTFFLEIRRPPGIACCLMLVILAFSCSQPLPITSIDHQDIVRKLDEQWSTTASARDLDGTLVFYGDDATLLPPNAPIASTKAAIRASWAAPARA
jgi:hypothetical protein